MAEQNGIVAEVESFIEQWQAGDSAMKGCFQALYRTVCALSGTSLSFVARPGVSYSLRPRHDNQTSRELFAMIDVIDDEPEARWLSVCFYGDMITDPEERGEVIPGGLAGSDGYCFDIYEADDASVSYLKARLEEAWSRAASC
ncbi:hypothetical protein [Desulfopila aestuarii]|uniref:Uncharacterized protein n=1 Tax=Desulfopila aestuarii DSM 18488 TaxID=1121416 RepID=A0A1M7Y2Q4_9BACT|nr:hypothetical protein [Desulfopila aestuarii]SHO46288.1 hypothetical protein SAMN02745220_01408 [Desulfopila aestuarii DSM 18488]